MKAPEENTKFYQVHGNKYENLLSSNDKISMDIIEHGLGDKPDETSMVKKEAVKKNMLTQKKQQSDEKSKHMRAFDAISIHFNDDADAIDAENWE